MTLLQEVAELSDFLTDVTAHRLRFSIEGLGSYREWKAYENWKEERRRLAYLRRQRMIVTRRMGERMLVQLTKEGARKALRDRLLTTSAQSRFGSCFVVFDIPETERVARAAFRRFLRECKFQRLQQSIWYTDKDISVLLHAYVKEWKLTPWIRIIVGKLLNEKEK